MSLLTNLVSYWKLDEASGNAADSVGSNTLTNTNTVSYSTTNAIINNSANFVASSAQRLSIADASQSGLDISGNFTFSFWMKMTNKPNTGGTYKTIFGKMGATTQYMFFLQPGGTYGARLTVDIYGGGVYTESVWDINLSTGTLYHCVLVCTVDNSQATKFTLYLNGSSQGNGSGGGNGNVTTIQNGEGTFCLGSYEATADWYYDGSLDEVGIWSRVLSSTEVTTLYNSGSGLQYPFTTSSSSQSPSLSPSASLSPSTSASPSISPSNSPSVSPMALADNLTAYYKFNSGALTTDELATYTLTNTNTVGETASGKIGYGADFGSSNTNKRLTTTTSQGTGTASMSMGAWVKFQTQPASGAYATVMAIIYQAGGNNAVYNYIYYNNNGGTYRLVFYRQTNSGGFSTYNTTLGTTDWHFLVYTVDSSYNVRGYLDGVLVAGPTVSAQYSTSDTTASQSAIGASDPSNNRFFASAFIDEVGIWNRQLSDAEVAELYNSGAGLQYPFTTSSSSQSPSLSPSSSASPSISPSESPSRSPSTSISPSVSPSLSPSTSVSPSRSPSTSISPSVSPSLSPSTSESPSRSPSTSESPSRSPSTSISPSLSPSTSISPSVSPSNSPSSSPSESPSESPSASPSASPSGSERRRFIRH